MIELQWVVNEITSEKYLYYRMLPGKPIDPNWQQVPIKTVSQAGWDDLIECGGLFPFDRTIKDEN